MQKCLLEDLFALQRPSGNTAFGRDSFGRTGGLSLMQCLLCCTVFIEAVVLLNIHCANSNKHAPW